MVGRHGPDNGDSLALLQGQQLVVLEQYHAHPRRLLLELLVGRAGCQLQQAVSNYDLEIFL